MRAFLAIVAVLALAGQAEAGHRCVRTYQTLRSNYGWSQSQGCYSCHQTSGQSYTHQRYQGDQVENILGGLAKKKTEYQALLDGLGKLGFSPTNGYQPSGQYQPNGYTTTGQYNEAYGLSQPGKTIYANLPHIDLMALANMSARLGSDGQGYGAQAMAGANEVISNVAGIAETQAVGQAAAAALAAARAPAASGVRQLNFQTQATAQVGTQAEPPAGIAQPAGENDLGSIIQNKCLACHNAEKASGALDFSVFANLPADQQGEILKQSFERVISSDPSKRMPMNLPELSTEQKAAFAAALVGGQ